MSDTNERTLALEYLARVLNEWAEKVDRSQNIVTIHTKPGAAHVVAGAMDSVDLSSVLATIAGDDVVLVVVKEGQDPTVVRNQLAELTRFGSE